MPEPELWMRCPKAELRNFNGVEGGEAANCDGASPVADAEMYEPLWVCLCHGTGNASLVRVSDGAVERAKREALAHKFYELRQVADETPEIFHEFIVHLLRAAVGKEQ